MRVRRRFQLALLVTILFAAGYEAIPRTINALHAIEQRHELAEASAAFAHLRVPASFLPRNYGCAFYPCYVVPEPPSRAELDLPAILASVHAQWRQLTVEDWNLSPAVSLSSGVSFGPVTGCTTVRRHRPVMPVFTTCNIAGAIDGQLISLFLGPYLAGSGKSTHWTSDSELTIAGPTAGANVAAASS
jgi:hypothetical protein